MPRRTMAVSATVLAVAMLVVAPASADVPSGSIYLVPPSAPTTVDSTAIGPGRVAWLETRPQTRVVSRAVQVTGTVLTRGAPKGYADPRATRLLAVSGQTTVYCRSDGSGGNELVVTRPDRTRVLTNTVCGASLSGTRLVYGLVQSAPHVDQVLLNLNDGVSTDLSVAYGATSAAVWGDYLVYSKADGSVWRRTLSTGVSTLLMPSVPLDNPPTEYEYLIIGVYVWGDWVGWDARYYLGDQTFFLRNARTRSDAVVVGRYSSDDWSHTYPQALTSEGILYSNSGFDPDPGTSAISTAIKPYTAPNGPWTITAPTAYPKNDSVPAGADSGVLAFADTDGLMRAAPTPHVRNPPRYLGNARTELRRSSGQTWTLLAPTSAPLSTCEVGITDADSTTAIRALPCTGAASQGEVATSWDLRDGSGHPAGPGQYRWTIIARNADGWLRHTNGTTAKVTGLITVS